MFYLYKITNLLSSKVYIGQSNKEVERWRQHKYFGRNPEKTSQYIHRAMARYGVDNFSYEVIAMCKISSEADELEKILIKQYDSQNKLYGYNIGSGGEVAWNRGLPKEQQPMFGKKQSEFQKQRMSEVHTGRLNPHSKEWSEQISDIMTGRVLTDEWKKKISESNLGILRSDKTKKKMADSAKGKIISDETKLKMSAAKIGKTKSVETKNRMSKSKMKFTVEQELKIVKLRKSGISASDLAKKFKCSEPTIYSIFKRYS